MYQPSHNLQPQTELQRQADLLREADYFVCTTDSTPLWEKQLIFLVLAGFKPLSEVYSAHWFNTPDGGQEALGDNPVEVRAFLDGLGLAHHVYIVDGDTTMAAVGRTPELIQTYLTAKDERVFGHMFGFPNTAVEAWQTKDVLTVEQQREVIADLDIFEPPFALSREHYRDEIALLHQWQQTLQIYGLADAQPGLTTAISRSG